MIRSFIRKAAKKGLLILEDKFLSKHICVEVAEIFFQHNGKSDFNRYDIIVRLLAVENYFGINECGFNFYKRMQAARIGNANVEEAVTRFRSLIKSYDENGYNEESEIELDKNLHLIDGSHRMAMAMYYNLPRINAIVRARADCVFYGIEWFAVNGFNEAEVAILKKKYYELRNRYITPFVCTLWSPVHAYYNEITEKLRLFGEITDVKDFQFNIWEYNFYTRGIYNVDDIAKWKIEKKIEYMHQASPTSHQIRMVCLSLDEPHFRLKAATNGTLSVRCELIKKLIRDAYKNKIDNYFHDIIIHIGDNFYQNRFIHSLMTLPPIDVEKILEDINQYQYVIEKYEVPYMPADFPKHYPLGKDIDILCQSADYKKTVQTIFQGMEPYKDKYLIKLIKGKDINGNENRTKIRLELENQFLILQFDITTVHDGDKRKTLFEDIIKNRKRVESFFIPTTKYELLLRMEELHKYPDKNHHAEYINNHYSSIDSDLCDKYLDFDWRKIFNQ